MNVAVIWPALLQGPPHGSSRQFGRHHLADFPWLCPRLLEEKKKSTSANLGDCFLKGKEVAYKAVMRPVEGTILTVIRESSSPP
jgi:hypothetical protein